VTTPQHLLFHSLDLTATKPSLFLYNATTSPKQHILLDYVEDEIASSSKDIVKKLPSIMLS
jgi:hypothetical protein